MVISNGAAVRASPLCFGFMPIRKAYRFYRRPAPLVSRVPPPSKFHHDGGLAKPRHESWRVALPHGNVEESQGKARDKWSTHRTARPLLPLFRQVVLAPVAGNAWRGLGTTGAMWQKR